MRAKAAEKFSDYYVSAIDEWAFVHDAAYDKLCRQFGVNSLKGYGVEEFNVAICSAGALIFYLEQTQHSGLKNICGISRIEEGKFVWMDRFTFRNLEIFSSAAGKDGVSLVECIDRTLTPMGARLLRSWLAMPIFSVEELNGRHDIVQYFLDNDSSLSECQSLLSGVGDLERIISRAATGKILPREVKTLSRSLSQMTPICQLASSSGVEALLKLSSQMHGCDALVEKIEHTLCANPAAQIGKGEVIERG